MEPIIVYESRGRLIWLLLLSVLFVLVDGWMLVTNRRGMSGFTAVAGIPFFGVGGLFILFRLLRRKPAVIIDNRGLTDHSSMLALGLVPWSDIIDAKIDTMQVRRSKTRYLAVSIRNFDVYLADCSALKQWMLRYNSRTYGYSFSISGALLAVKLEVLLAGIKSFIKH